MLWELFLTFLMIGFVSFGGGYAMIPIIEREVVQNHDWGMSTQNFTDVIAVAGMSPGPIATNSAIFVGYETAGWLGAIIATLGMVLPSLAIILIVATFFYKVQNNQIVKWAFYGLRPIIAGLIFYAAIRFALKNGVVSAEMSWHALSLLCIFAISLFALVKLKIHPVFVIMLSGVAGAALYG